MRSKILTAVMAATALATAPAFAGPGGAHGGGPAGGAGGAAAGNAGGPAGAALDARMNSMGPGNASATGIEHANSNSVLGTNATTSNRANGSAQMNRMFPGTKASSHVKSGSLAGLSTGMMLTSNGTNVGTVQQIRTSADGTARVVFIQGTNGRMFAIPANKLSLANGTLTTTARLNGINGGTFANPAIGISQGPNHASAAGIAHANSRSVLAGGTVTAGSLAGLSVGTTVQMNGNTVGTVQRIVTSNDGTVRRVLVTGTDGRMISLSPSHLSFSGGVLTTTSLRGG